VIALNQLNRCIRDPISVAVAWSKTLVKDEIMHTGNGEEQNTPLLGHQVKRHFGSNTPLTRIEDEVIISGLVLVNSSKEDGK
jgi:hypothetical protein